MRSRTRLLMNCPACTGAYETVQGSKGNCVVEGS